MDTLKELRVSRGLKQEDMATALGISRPRYCQIEKDPDRARIEQARMICEILDCSMDDIFLPVKVK